MSALKKDLTELLTQLNDYRHTEPTDELLAFIIRKQEISELHGRIEQSYRCKELIEANANSPEDSERYGEIVLLDVDDLQEDMKVANG